MSYYDDDYENSDENYDFDEESDSKYYADFD